MQNFDLHKYLRKNPLLEDENSNSEDFLDLLFEVIVENYCEENNILRENLNENFLKKLKSGIKDLSSKAKNRAKSAIDKINSAISDPKQALKDLAKIQKLYSKTPTKKFIKDLQYAASFSNKSDLKEADQGSFTDMEQITGLEGGDTFTWNGENQSSQYVNVKVENNEDEEQGVLIPGKTYTKIDKLNIDGAGKDRTVIYLTSIDQKEFEKDEKRKTLLGFFGKYPKMKNLIASLMFTLGVYSVFSGITGNTPFESSATFQNNFIELVQDGDIDSILPDPDSTVTLGGPFPTDGENSTNDSVVDKVSNSLDKANVDLGDTNLDNTDNNNAAVQTHDVGEYKISDAEKEAIVKNLVEETLEDLNNQIDKLKGKVINSIDLDIDFGGVVSNQGDADSNKADDGTDLIKGRSDTAEDIAKKAGEQLTKIIQNTLGDNVKVNINYDLVDTHDSYQNQVEEEARDEMGTQSSFETITVKGIDAVEGETNETPPDLMYNYLFDPQNPPSKIPTKPSPKKSTTTAKPSKSDFDNVNRNNQIAVILGQINPKLDIYDKLENEGIKSELVSDLKDIRNNEKASKELKDLAILILSIRKNPSIFLDKVSKATGIKFDTRAKAKMLGGGEKGKSAAKLGLAESVFTSIKEGVVADRIEQAISDSDIASKRDEVIALLGSMYKSSTQKDGKRLSILNPDTLKPNELEKLKGLGFSTKDKSGRYIFMDSEEEVSLEKDKKDKKPESDEKENNQRIKRFSDKLDAKPNLKKRLKLIDRNIEVAPVLISLFLTIPDKLKKKNIINKMIDDMRKDPRLKTLDDKEKIKEENKATQDVNNFLDIFDDSDQLKLATSQLLNPKDVINVFFDELLPEMPGINKSELDNALKKIKQELSKVEGNNVEDIESAFRGLGITQKGEKKKEIETPIWNASQKVNYTLTEGLTEDESKAVLDKYKQRYAAILKSNPDFIKKYPNPDKVIYGMVMNEIKKLREKLSKNADLGDHIEDFMNSDAPQFQGKSKKKIKQMATAAFLNKEEQKLDEIDAMMEEEKLPVNDIKKAIKDLIKKEGGAVGLGPILKLAKDFDGVTQIDVEDILDNQMDDVKKHKDGDYINTAGLNEIIDEDLERKSTTYEKVAKFIKDELESNNVKNRTDLKQILRAIQNKNTYMLPMKRQNMLQNLMRQAKKGNMDKNKLNELVKAALMGPISEKKNPLENPEKADLNRDGKLSDYEKTRGAAIEKAIAKKKVNEVDSGYLRITDKIRQAGKKAKGNVASFLEEFNKLTSNAFKSDKSRDLVLSLAVSDNQLKDVDIKNAQLAEDKVKGSNVRKDKSEGDWEVVSGKTKKPWPQDFKTKKSARAAIRGYHASKNESLAERILKELRK